MLSNFKTIFYGMSSYDSSMWPVDVASPMMLLTRSEVLHCLAHRDVIELFYWRMYDLPESKWVMVMLVTVGLRVMVVCVAPKPALSMWSIGCFLTLILAHEFVPAVMRRQINSVQGQDPRLSAPCWTRTTSSTLCEELRSSATNGLTD